MYETTLAYTRVRPVPFPPGLRTSQWLGGCGTAYEIGDREKVIRHRGLWGDVEFPCSVAPPNMLGLGPSCHTYRHGASPGDGIWKVHLSTSMGC